jgi:hypothetical protein
LRKWSSRSVSLSVAAALRATATAELATAFQLFIGTLISLNEKWDMNLLPDQLPAR